MAVATALARNLVRWPKRRNRPTIAAAPIDFRKDKM
jgi:hypothetical protein